MRAALVPVLPLLAAFPLFAQVDPHLRVDQFGYRPNAKKVAVLRSAVVGWDAPAPYVPGTTIEVRRVADNAVVWSGPAVAWQSGAVHTDSGDRCWLADFSMLRTPGDYVVHDPANSRTSPPFRIAADVYDAPLRAAVRMFFYQRCGLPKQPPFAHANWADGASHLGPQQDADCRAVLNPVPSTSRDLRGGWFDAGDYNKYVNFADDCVHALLDAFLDAPAYWPDDFGIPESGNGIPDLLDEVKVELDWLLRMQSTNGSLLHKVSVTSFAAASPPSADTAFRRYAPATASATATGAAVFAHAAVAFGMRPEPAMQSYAAQLDQAAAAAWSWLAANPGAIPSSYDNQGFANVAAEDDAYTQQTNRLAAAAWRFVRTGDPAMRTFVDGNHTSTHLFQWSWASPWEDVVHGALLAYTEAPACTASVAAAIRQAFRSSVVNTHLAPHTSGSDPYGAHLAAQDYTWGSNSTKCMHGQLLLWANRYGLAANQAHALADAAEQYLHYLHGVNPPGLTFLTNARGIGAEGSVDEMYHSWFADGTVWDNASTSPFGPAPGYLTGGANPYFAPDPSYSGPPLVPPQNQPAMKSYRDWNPGWPQNSWEITEPAIGYQGRYVRLLGALAIAPAPQLAVQLAEVTAGSSTSITVGGADGNQLVALVLALDRGRATVDLGFWSLDLGVQLLPNPAINLLGIAAASATGAATYSLPSLPASAIGIRLHLQASQVQGGEPLQSAVVSRTIR